MDANQAADQRNGSAVERTYRPWPKQRGRGLTERLYRALPLIALVSSLLPSLQIARPLTVEAASYSATVLGDAPAIYYRLGESSGTTAVDSSGNGRNGTYTTAAVLGQPGAIPSDADTAISTSGQAVSYGTAGLPLGNSVRSTEVWFQTSSWNNQTMVSYGQDSACGGWAIQVLDQDHLDIRVICSQNAFVFSPNRTISDGNWHHVVATYDGAQFAMYLDSVSLGTQVISIALNTVSTGMRIGSLNAPGDIGFQGRLDEVAIYPTALSAAQVAAHFAASGNTLPTAASSVSATAETNAALVRWQPATATTPSGQSPISGYIVSASAAGASLGAVGVGGSATSATLHGLSATSGITVQVVAVNGFGTGSASSATVSAGGAGTTYASAVLSGAPNVYYRFGDPSGSIAADASGSGQHGTYFSGATLGLPGVVSNDPDTAVSPGNFAITYCQPCSKLPTLDSPRSFELWFNTTWTFRQALFTYGSESGCGCGSQSFAIELLNPTTLYVRTIDQNDPQWTLPKSVADGKWHQVVVTYSNPTFTAYIDGSAVGTFTHNSALHTVVDATGLITGALHDGTDKYSGTMDEFSIYPTALSGATVSNHYALATAAFAPIGSPVTPPNTYGGGDYCQSCLSRKFGRSFRAEPIDTADGNFWETWTDLSIPGRGFSLLFSRTYNSLNAPTNGPLGFGWSHSYAASLSVDATTGNVTLTQENGGQAVFNKTSSGTPPTYAPAAPRDIATLTQALDGSWTLTRHSLQTLSFSAAGQLTSLTNQNGYKTTLSYDANGHLSSVTDPASRTVSVHFTGAVMSSISDATGRTVSYGYNDGAGNLTDVTDVNGGHWQYAYDTSHRLLTAKDPRQNVVTTNHYDSSGRVDYQLDGLQRKTTFAYSADGKSTVTTDPKGNAVQDVFTSGVRTSETRGYGTSQAATWTYAYDPSSLGVASITDPNGHVTTMGYDSSGNLISRVDALQRTTLWTYNSLNEPTGTTDPNGVTTTLTYDSKGNLLTTSTPLVGSSPQQSSTTTNTYGDASHPGDVTAVTDANAKQWQRSYDTYGDLASATDPLGDKTTYTYNSLGWLQTTVTPKGNVTGGTPSQFTTAYSYADPTTGSINQFGDVRVVTDPLSHQVVTTYDADRNVTTLKDADGNITQQTYDTANQETDVVRADGTKWHTDYNADGTILDQLDGAHNTTTYGYDPLGRVTSVADPLQRTTTYTFDGAGNRLTLVDAQSPAQTTRFAYDAANQLTGVTYSDGKTPNVSGIQYDSDGQRTQMTDGTGTSRWAYDSLHRMTSSSNGAGSAVAYGYDLKGQLTSIIYPGNHTAQRVYDDAGRLTSVADWLGHTTTLTPDADSNLTSETYPNGTTAASAYDNSDHLTSISDAPTATPNSPFATFTYGRDKNSQVASVTSTGVPADSHSYTYTQLNQLRGVDSQSYAYSAADAVTQLTNGTVLASDAADQLSTSQTQPITVVGTASAGDTGTGKSLTINLPAGVAANDQILVASTQQSGKTVNVPTGYTQIASVDSGGSPAANTTLFRATAAGGEAQVSVTYQTKFSKSVTVIVYRGVSSTTPIDTQSSGTSAATTTVTTSTITPQYGGDRLALFAGAVGNATAAAWTAPAGMTGQVQFAGQSSTSSAAFDQTLYVAGATGPRTVTLGTTAEFAAVMVALRPASLTIHAYDPRGDRLSSTPPSGTATTYTYDQANRLKGYGSSATYSYDGDGARQSKTVSGTLESFTWNEAGRLPSLLVDATSTSTTYFLYGPGDAPVEQITSSGTVYYFHKDQLGSTRLLTNQAGSVVATFTYDAYGNVASSTGSVTTPLLYAGQYRDAESGLYYLRARYYDPATAQFLSRDPAVAKTRSPYGYVYGNPLNFIDPTGLAGWCSDLDRTTNADSCTPVPPASALGKVPVGTIQCNGDPSALSTLCYQSQPVNRGAAVGWVMVKNESWRSAVAGLLPTDLPNTDTLGELCNRLNNLTGGILVDPAATSGSPNGVPSSEDDPMTKAIWLINFPGNFIGAVRNSQVQ